MSAAKAKPSGKTRRVKTKGAGPEILRQFRFNAAQTVQMRFAGEKKPEHFRIDDMAEVAMTTLDGQTRAYFQYRLLSTDKKNRDGSDRTFWFFDPRPVGAADPAGPSLWQPMHEQPLDGCETLKHQSGNFSTRSVTSYDGSGSCHVVKVDDKPTYRMRLDLNGKRDFCESRPIAIRKGDVLVVARS
jgi:hypothetical protein